MFRCGEIKCQQVQVLRRKFWKEYSNDQNFKTKRTSLYFRLQPHQYLSFVTLTAIKIENLTIFLEQGKAFVHFIVH